MPVRSGSRPSCHSLVLGELCQQSGSIFLRGHYNEDITMRVINTLGVTSVPCACI